MIKENQNVFLPNSLKAAAPAPFHHFVPLNIGR
jgi:hypothetical protein